MEKTRSEGRRSGIRVKMEKIFGYSCIEEEFSEMKEALEKLKNKIGKIILAILYELLATGEHK
ncbi:MAG: hypothetical protein JXM74_04800 [Fusobacteriaceae bacterium]|nr:hypothetical protein [Fusobacteriaceae bacterium]MBN2838054.1 hypothetical protein [Fusobacteriaceae bacterium]